MAGGAQGSARPAHSGLLQELCLSSASDDRRRSAECFLGPVADALALGIAGMARVASLMSAGAASAKARTVASRWSGLIDNARLRSDASCERSFCSLISSGPANSPVRGREET